MRQSYNSDPEILATMRASSVSEFFDCALRWYYKHIEGVRGDTSAAAWLGTSIHHGTALFDQARLAGEDPNPDESAGEMVHMLHHAPDDIDWGDDSAAKLESTALHLHGLYCRDIAPARDYAAVELHCEALDITTEHGVLRMTGTTDRVRRYDDGRLGISDIKSGKRAVSAQGAANTSGHAPQLGVYTLIAEQEMGQPLEAPAEIIGLNTGKPRVAAGVVDDPTSVLVGTEDQPGMIDLAAHMLKAGTTPPNPKSMLCSEKYCPAYRLCSYHK